jgi:hypothetical protein
MPSPAPGRDEPLMSMIRMRITGMGTVMKTMMPALLVPFIVIRNIRM